MNILFTVKHKGKKKEINSVVFKNFLKHFYYFNLV